MVVSDEALAVVVPIVVYWVYSAMYMTLGTSMDKYRLHSRREEHTMNLVSKRDVAKGVLLQQLVQAASAAVVLTITGDRSSSTPATTTTTTKQAGSSGWWSPPWPWWSLLTLALQLGVGMVVLDGWQYAWHRYLHHNAFLYKHVHSWHHRVVVPYAFGTLYNHPAEGLVLDTGGGLLAYAASGMSARAAVLFFSICTVKAVDDHCGLLLPWNPIQRCFRNNAAYHDLHHAIAGGGRRNFSQPFFVTWDWVFGTHVPYVVHDRPGGGGGFMARPAPAVMRDECTPIITAAKQN